MTRFGRDDAGSVAPLAILGLVLSLIASLVLLSSTSVLEQQRRLNSISDALALDLADLKLMPKAVIDLKVANAELAALTHSAGSAEATNALEVIRVVSLEQPNAKSVSVRLCQANRLLSKPFINLIGSALLGEVCVTSSAENF